ncbi:MAG TPA: hypothetical protein VNG90_05590 [Candidatus Acidoferrum sp.]|nr:hypothetical protein [Candidatus Acidoferrum sp.]
MAATMTGAYRVIRITTDEFDTPTRVTEAQEWIGTLDELNQRYPTSKVWGADELSHSEIEDGWIRFDYRFERQIGGDQWEVIDDPRDPPSDTMTDRERAIDDENRRLFPGEYVHEYEDFNCLYCRDRGCPECEPWGGMTDEDLFDCPYCYDGGCERCQPPEPVIVSKKSPHLTRLYRVWQFFKAFRFRK